METLPKFKEGERVKFEWSGGTHVGTVRSIHKDYVMQRTTIYCVRDEVNTPRTSWTQERHLYEYEMEKLDAYPSAIFGETAREIR